MSLLSAINQAQTAAGHARPFMKLMDALAELDKEARSATALVAAADAAAARKAQLESEIPALESKHAELTSEVAGMKSNLDSQRAAFDEGIARTVKAADDEIKRNHAAILADHMQKIAEKKSEILSLQASVDELVKAKGDIQAKIDELRESFKTAHAALA